MGNYKSKLNQAKQTPFHPSLLKPYVFTNKNQKFMTIKITSSKEQYDSWFKSRANFKQMIKNQRHLFWPKETSFEKIGIFGDSGYSVLTFSYCPVTLKDEIINRNRSGVSFQQKELWYLFNSLISLAQQAHRYNETLGDIRPLNILLSQKGQINVMTKQSLPSESKNIEKTLKSSMPTFLSPEQIETIHSDPKRLVKCTPASQCFSIGLTLLVTSIFRIGDQLYLPPKTFQKDLLKEYIRQLDEQTTLDDGFKLLIKGLCQINPSKRFTAQQVCKCLQDYQRLIYSLSPFQLDPLPDKMLRKLNPNKLKKVPSIENFSFTGKSQKGLFKSFKSIENVKVNNHLNKIKEKQEIKPHYISQKLLQKIRKALKSKQQRMGLKPGSLSLQKIEFSAFKDLLQQESKQSKARTLKQRNLKSSEDVFYRQKHFENSNAHDQKLPMKIPKLFVSTENEELLKLNTPPKNKKVRWEESQELIKTSQFKQNPSGILTSNEMLETINQMKENTNPNNNLQASISNKVKKKDSGPYPFTLSTFNSFEFGSTTQSPHKQGLFGSQIIQDKQFGHLNNLSQSNCSVEKNR